MRLALFQPDIPQNLGASIRLAACLGVPLDVIEPCGFPLSDRAIRRAAMDYGALAEVVRHPNWAAFGAWAQGARNSPDAPGGISARRFGDSFLLPRSIPWRIA